MKKDIEIKIEQARELHSKLLKELAKTRGLSEDALRDAALDELRLGDKGVFVWLKDQTFDDKFYKAGDTIKASEIGLHSRGRQIVHMTRVLQPKWHVEMGQKSSELMSRARALEDKFIQLGIMIRESQRAEKQIEDLQSQLELAKKDLASRTDDLASFAEQLLELPELTKGVS